MVENGWCERRGTFWLVLLSGGIMRDHLVVEYWADALKFDQMAEETKDEALKAA